jgi:hypothetical protein
MDPKKVVERAKRRALMLEALPANIRREIEREIDQRARRPSLLLKASEREREAEAILEHALADTLPRTQGAFLSLAETDQERHRAIRTLGEVKALDWLDVGLLEEEARDTGQVNWLKMREPPSDPKEWPTSLAEYTDLRRRVHHGLADEATIARLARVDDDPRFDPSDLERTPPDRARELDDAFNRDRERARLQHEAAEAQARVDAANVEGE